MGDKLFFHGLTPTQLDRLAEIIKVREVEAGCVILKERDYGEALYVVDHGRVDVRLDAPDGPRTLATIAAAEPDEMPREGDFVGEMCLLDLEPRCASIVALEPTRLWEINRDDLYWLFGDDKELQLRILVTVARVLSRRLKVGDEPRARAVRTG